MSSFSEYLGPLAPHVPAALIAPAGFSRITEVAGLLPGGLAGETFGFECKLDEAPSRGDFLLCVTAASNGRESLAQLDPAVGWQEALAAHPVWRRVQDFATSWADPASPLHRRVDNVWLEFDVAPEALEVPAPSLFFAPLDKGAAESLAVTTLALERLSGGPRSPELSRPLAACFEALPQGARVFQVGAMLARSTPAVRLCIDGLTPVRLAEYLHRVGWEGSLEAWEHATGELSGLVDEVCLAIDVGQSVGPKLGLELYFARGVQPAQEPRWRTLLERLVQRGLCTSAKCEAVLAWPGLSKESSEGETWPEGLRRTASFLGPRALSVFVRALHHIKVSYLSGRPLEAKVYLAARHHWHMR